MIIEIEVKSKRVQKITKILTFAVGLGSVIGGSLLLSNITKYFPFKGLLASILILFGILIGKTKIVLEETKNNTKKLIK